MYCPASEKLNIYGQDACRKLFLVAFAVIAAVAADVSHLPSNEYLPPAQEVQAIEAPSNEYLAPEADYAGEQGSLAADGYRYKTHRRVVLRRHRRDVSHLPSNEYLPPQEEVQTVEAPSNEYLAPEADYAGEQGSLSADGYRYKTHRRVVLRRHRLPAPQFRLLPQLPHQLQSRSLLPLPQPQLQLSTLPPLRRLPPAHELADDGYRYKTHRRVVIRRNRRDVSHLPSNEYLPPQEVAAQAPSNEYLPPQQVAAPVQAAPAPVEYAPVEEAAPAHELADDGYRYKTHRRVVIRRHRRDVSHLPSNEYLPPQSAAPSAEYLPPVQVAAPAPVQVVAAPAPAPAPVEYAAPVEEAAPAHELADDGYRYKTHRRVVIRRNRRDVSHLPSNEYLPPVQQEAVPTSEYLPPVSNVVDEYSGVEQGNLANDGYRYKTHRRVVLRRHRRDVSHLPSNEYLPPQAAAPSAEYLPPAPVQVAAPAPAPVLDVSVPVEEAAPAHELADDGYRYKTQRRVVYRRH
ncbi:uncharacterized protein LOC133840117 [Drosophila sulfurigaster albostrigata]|uniref:uncharacterized protein LOC133840117 n=1 Tax=Drosophila sulfurigaster albostrigata TaxID=89887 RepID=UPI002D21C56C|nr:uncharacterized protein LOC133840117 [Drosophila sulfurigaster albostrigata]